MPKKIQPKILNCFESRAKNSHSAPVSHTGSVAGLTYTRGTNATATLSGTPRTAGTYTLTITATNNNGTATQTFTLTVS